MLMQPMQFIYWLKGILDANPDGLSGRQFDLIKNTTDSMFDHGDKVEVEKPTLKELLKDTDALVVENVSTQEFMERPKGIPPNWVKGFHGWGDPNNRMRC